MSRMYRHRLRTIATGFGIAAIFMAGAAVTDLGGMATRLMASGNALWLGLGLYAGLGVIFSAVQAVLSSTEKDERPGPPRGRRMRREPVPVRVRVESRNRRR